MELSFEYMLYCCLGLAAILMYILSSRLMRGNSSRPPLPPGSYGWPIIGETVQFWNMGRKGKLDAFFTTRMSKHNENIFKTSFGGEKTVVLCGTAGNKLVFTSEKQSVLTFWPNFLAKVFGPSFITAPYDEAVRTRNTLLGFLKKDSLHELVQRFDKVCKKRLAEDWAGKDQVKAFSLVEKYAFCVVCEVFTGINDSNRIAKLLDEFEVLGYGLFALPIYFPGTKHYNSVKAADWLRKELMKTIEFKRSFNKGIKSSDNINRVDQEPADLISYLIDEIKEEEGRVVLTDKEIANNLMVLMQAGHASSSATMMLVIKYLAESPECYLRVLEEQTDIAMSKGPGELLNKDDLKKMKYSWSVACEVLRLWPPIPGTFREAIVDFTYSGFSVPKGWKIWWNPYSTHTDEYYFPQPDKFDPSRFDKGTPAPYSFVPFGGGPRMCPGKEFAKVQILVFMHNLVRQFRWQLVLPDEKIIIDPTPVARQGLPIYLYPQTQA